MARFELAVATVIDFTVLAAPLMAKMPSSVVFDVFVNVRLWINFEESPREDKLKSTSDISKGLEPRVNFVLVIPDSLTRDTGFGRAPAVPYQSADVNVIAELWVPSA